MQSTFFVRKVRWHHIYNTFGLLCHPGVLCRLNVNVKMQLFLVFSRLCILTTLSNIWWHLSHNPHAQTQTPAWPQPSTAGKEDTRLMHRVIHGTVTTVIHVRREEMDRRKGINRNGTKTQLRRPRFDWWQPEEDDDEYDDGEIPKSQGSMRGGGRERKREI